MRLPLLLCLAGVSPNAAFQTRAPPAALLGTPPLRSSRGFARRSQAPALWQSTTTDTETNQEQSATSSSSSPKGYFFASVEGQGVATSSSAPQTTTRVLGSQELLMLPRQYGPKLKEGVTFPQMNHASATIVSSTPSKRVLIEAIRRVVAAHPLLRARVDGDGEPTKRIDLFQMVREGDPHPPTFVAPPPSPPAFWDASEVLRTIRVPENGGTQALTASWRTAFERDLNDGSWCNPTRGPLWKLEWHRLGSEDDSTDLPCALVLAFNHAISDQSSANRLLDQILRQVALLEEEEKEGGSAPSSLRPAPQKMPVSVEDSVLGMKQRWNDIQTKGLSPATVQYVLGKAAEGLKDPVILPDNTGGTSSSNPLGALSIISGRAAGGADAESQTRRSLVEFRTVDRDTTSALLDECRKRGVSVSNALTAAVTLTATDVVGSSDKQRNYKVLQSLDMRRFGAQIDQGDTVACMAGSHDLMHGPLPDGSGRRIRESPVQSELFWELARQGKQQTEDFVKSGGPQQAVRVFDFAMSISDLNNLVHLTAQSKDTKGRAYSAGSTNVGVYERLEAFAWDGEESRKTLQTQHGRYKITDVFFATPHTTSGCLYPVSCLCLNGELKCTFHPVYPIVSEEANKQFADAFVGLLEAVAIGKKSSVNNDGPANGGTAGPLASIPENLLPLATALVGAAAVASHGPAWVDFFKSLAEMKANVENPEDFWAALNFWIFFAVGHPILQPILWISDVLHGTPGPKIADLVPSLFLAGNVLAIGIVAVSKEVSHFADHATR